MLYWVLKKNQTNISYNIFNLWKTEQKKTNKEMSFYLHQLLQFHFDILQTSDVVPGDVWNLHDGLAKSTWTALAHGVLKQYKI